MALYRFQSPLAVSDSPVAKAVLSENAAAVNSEKPQILMVGMHLTRTRGGITTLTANILESPLKDEFDIAYIASQAEDAGRSRKLFIALTALLQFFWACLFRRPDLVYVHIGSNASLYRESVFVVLARLLRIRVLSHFHAGDFEEYYRSQPWLGRRLIRKAIGLSTRVVAVSQASADQLEHLNSKLRIAVIPNSIDISAFLDRNLLGDRSKPNRMLHLLFVGSVGKLKGEKDLIDAMAMLRHKGVNVRASFLGYGAENLAEYLEQRGLSDLVDRLGPVATDERYEFYEKADIFVLPTYAEAMPISVIEAMAAGLGIVTTRAGGIPEIIDHRSEGLLVESGDVKALAESIEYLVENTDARHEMGRNARRRCIRQMDFPAYLNRLRTELNQACGIIGA